MNPETVWLSTLAKFAQHAKLSMLYDPPHSWWREVWRVRFLVTFAIGFAVSCALDQHKVVRIATLALDREMLSAAALTAAEHGGPPDSLNVKLVTLDEEADYPLPPLRLKRAICALLYQEPAVIVVDVDTSRREYLGLTVPTGVSRVVWGQRMLEGERQNSQAKVLGTFDLGAALPPKHSAGIAAVERADDWSIRRYSRWVDIERVGPRRTLHFEAVCAYPGPKRSLPRGISCEYSKVQAIHVNEARYWYQFERRPLDDIIDLMPAEEMASCEKSARVRTHPTAGAYRDRVVVLGFWNSTFDMHPTPFGDQPGMQIVASAIQHEIKGTTLGRLHHLGTLVLDFVLSLAIVFVHTRLRPFAAMFAVLLFLGGLVYWGAFLTLILFGFQASVVPCLLGIHLEQLTSSAERAAAVSSGGAHA